MKKVVLTIGLLAFINSAHATLNRDIMLPSGLVLEIKHKLIDAGDVIYTNNEDDIELIFSAGSNVTLPEEAYLQSLTSDKKNHSFTAKVAEAGASNLTIEGRYEEYVQVPVLKTNIQHGDIITREDITSERVSVQKIKRSTIKDAEDLLGKSPRFNITALRPITEEDVVSPRVIKKGDQVTLDYDSGSVIIQTSGVAMEHGAIGDLIKVKNARSEVIIQGVVESKSIVHVHNPNTKF